MGDSVLVPQIRNLKNVDDLRRKQRQLKNAIDQGAKVDKDATQAFKYYAEQIKHNVSPIMANEAMLDSARQDQVSQYNIALDHLKSIMPAPYAASAMREVLSGPAMVEEFNRHWPGFSKSMQGVTNVDVRYLRQYWSRYRDLLNATGQTGIVVPLFSEDIKKKPDPPEESLTAASMEEIYKKYRKEQDTLRPPDINGRPPDRPGLRGSRKSKFTAPVDDPAHGPYLEGGPAHGPYLEGGPAHGPYIEGGPEHGPEDRRVPPPDGPQPKPISWIDVLRDIKDGLLDRVLKKLQRDLLTAPVKRPVGWHPPMSRDRFNLTTTGYPGGGPGPGGDGDRIKLPSKYGNNPEIEPPTSPWFNPLLPREDDDNPPPRSTPPIIPAPYPPAIVAGEPDQPLVPYSYPNLDRPTFPHKDVTKQYIGSTPLFEPTFNKVVTTAAEVMKNDKTLFGHMTELGRQAADKLKGLDVDTKSMLSVTIGVVAALYKLHDISGVVTTVLQNAAGGLPTEELLDTAVETISGKSVEETLQMLGPNGQVIIGNGLRRRRMVGSGIEPDDEVRYQRFGKYLIHMPSLQRNVLNIKFPSTAAHPRLPQKIVSEELAELVRDLLENGQLNPTLYAGLSEDDKIYFGEVAHLCQISNKLGISRKEDNSDMKRFAVVRGEILSGNDAPQLIKELKYLTLKLVADGKIPKKSAHDLLFEISVLS